MYCFLQGDSWIAPTSEAGSLCEFAGNLLSSHRILRPSSVAFGASSFSKELLACPFSPNTGGRQAASCRTQRAVSLRKGAFDGSRGMTCHTRAAVRIRRKLPINKLHPAGRLIIAPMSTGRILCEKGSSAFSQKNLLNSIITK